jgi:hypothetical protein
VTWLALTIAALAAYRLTRLIVEDDFPPVAWLREKWLGRWPASDTVFDPSVVVETGDGEGRAGRVDVVWVPALGDWVARQPHPLGELIACYWCLGFWVATVCTLLVLAVPGAGMVVLAPFAVSTVVGALARWL